MKWRVRSVETGEEMFATDGYEYLLHNDGSISAVHDVNNDSYPLARGFVVEFAFESVNGEWDYSHAVMHE